MGLGANGVKLKKKTKIIQAGIDIKKYFGSLTTPIFYNSTIAFKEYKTFTKAKRNKQNDLYYGRFKTKTVQIFEQIMTDLYESEKAIITSSGLSAIIITLSSFLSKNDNIIFVENCYEPAANFIRLELKKFGINHKTYPPVYNKSIEKLIDENTKLMYLESPTSLNFEIQDIEKFVKTAKKKNILTIMDNTWSTFYGCNPLKFGVDIVIESGTKYLSGHSDCFCGIIACSNSNFKKIYSTKIRFGDFVSSENCFLAIRGLKTLPIRLKNHFKNTKKVLAFLKKNQSIEKILYPGMSENENYLLWKKYHSTANGLISFKLKEIRDRDISCFIDKLKIFKIGFSWGGFESLILPIESLDSSKSDKKGNSWFRIHVGLENPSDLISDLKQAINKYKQNEV